MNNDIGDSQKTSNLKVRSHFTFYSPSSINLNFLDKFEVQTSFTSQKDGKKNNSTTPDNRVLQRCSQTRTPKDVYKQRGQGTAWLHSCYRTEGRQSHTQEMDGYRMASKNQTTEWRPRIKQHCSKKT